MYPFSRKSILKLTLLFCTFILPLQAYAATSEKTFGQSLKCFFSSIIFFIDTPEYCLELPESTVNKAVTVPAPYGERESPAQSVVYTPPVFQNTVTERIIKQPTVTYVQGETIISYGISREELQSSLFGLKKEILSMMPASSVTYASVPASPAYSIAYGVASTNYVDDQVASVSNILGNRIDSLVTNASSSWQQNGSALYYNNGYVGIGTSTPAASLHLSDNVSDGASLRLSNQSFPEADISLFSKNGSSAYAQLLIRPSFGNKAGGIALAPSGTGNGSFVQLATGGTSWYLNANSTQGFSIDTGVFGNRFAILSGGNIGISTSTPSSRFSVKGGGTGTGQLIQFSDSADTPRFTMLDNGSIGIGTTTPEYAIDIQNAAVIALRDFQTSAGGGGFLRLMHARGTSAAPLVVGAADRLGALIFQGYDGATFSTNATIEGYVDGVVATSSIPTSLRFFTTSIGATGRTERLRIDNAGNIGIGSTTPGALLSIKGTTGSTTDMFHIASSTNASMFIVKSTGGVGIGTTTVGSSTAINIDLGTTKTEGIHIGGTNDKFIFLERFNSGGRGLVIGQQNAGQIYGGNASIIRSAGGVDESIQITPGLNLTGGQGSVQIAALGGHVSIGNTSPQYKLDISTSTAGTADMLRLQNSIAAATNSGAGLLFAANRTGGTMTNVAQVSGVITDITAGSYKGALVFSTANNGNPTERMRIDSSGNLGIGTTTPTSKLHIITATSSSALRTSDGTVTTDIFNGTSGSNTGGFIGTVSNHPLFFYTNSGNPSQTILSNGNIGIGTTTPVYKLDVVTNANSAANGIRIANINTGTGNQGRLTFTNDGSSQAEVFFSGNNDLNTPNSFGFWNESSNGNILLATNNTERLRITSAGNLGIGTSTPSATLTASGTIRFISLGSAGANLVTDSLGNVTVSSDERLKDIQGDFETGLEQIKKISPITYKWRPETGYDSSSTYAGFSAQNIQSAIPEAVSTDNRGFLTLADRPILATLVNAVKELAEKVEGIALWFSEDSKTLTVPSDGKVQIEGEFCVDDICMTKQEFKSMMINAKSGTQPVYGPAVPTPTPPANEPTDEEVTEPEEPAADPVVVVEPVSETPVPVTP